jgi:endoribonuclease Dicer
MQVIAFLDTGAGKTLIAVMLVRHFADQYVQAMRKGIPTRRKIVVCLVPTQILVAQQAAVFRRHTNLGVAEYAGSRGFDSWQKDRWQEEFGCAPAPITAHCCMFGACAKCTSPLSAGR